MATQFSEAFVRLRKAAGFDTAYQFFHKNGGAKVFGCTFQNYLRIEKGTNLPLPKRLPQLCSVLRVPLHSSERKKLARAYLETWTGSSDVTDWLISPFESPDAPEAALDPARSALRKIVRESARPIGMEEYEAIMSSEASYWCYRVLTTATEDFSEERMAGLLGLPAAAVRQGLETLRLHGIAKRSKDGSYSSPLSGEFLVFPDTATIPPALMKRVYSYNEKMLRRKGRLVDERYCGVRADGRALEGFLAHFREAIRSVNAYAQTEKTDQSGLFFVEGRVLKLFDF
jgi:transcriptional regulator with XRE-family HTH domain